VTRGWFGEQYEGGHCQPFCPFIRDCPSCAFRGGDSSVAQQDSARESDARCAVSEVARGTIETAPGVASTNTEGLTRSSGTSREGMASMIATSDPARTPNGEVSCAREV
jgi:hypothetical protein